MEVVITTSTNKTRRGGKKKKKKKIEMQRCISNPIVLITGANTGSFGLETVKALQQIHEITNGGIANSAF
jgi:FlaA1/EpsC-like NDP-sugar epimerase